MAKLGPDVITEEINIDDDDPGTDTDAAAETCVSVQCQKQIKGGIPVLQLSVVSASTGFPVSDGTSEFHEEFWKYLGPGEMVERVRALAEQWWGTEFKSSAPTAMPAQLDIPVIPEWGWGMGSRPQEGLGLLQPLQEENQQALGLTEDPCLEEGRCRMTEQDNWFLPWAFTHVCAYTCTYTHVYMYTTPPHTEFLTILMTGS